MQGKKGILGAGLFLLSVTSVNAGFYAGAGLGPDVVDFRDTAHVVRPGTFDVYTATDLSATGTFGTLFAGYDWHHEKLYWAGEINGNLSSTSFNTLNEEIINSSISSTAINLKHSLGISVLPGYQIAKDTLFYGRLGLMNSRIKVITSDVSLENLSTRRNGLRYGLGIKQAINERFAVRLDYSRIHYKAIDSGIFEPIGGVTKTTHRTPTQQLVEFGLIVTFA